MRGLRARGAFELDMRWRGGRLESAVLRSLKGNPVRLRAAQRLSVVSSGSPVKVEQPEPAVAAFPTRAGEVYELKP